MKTIALIAHDNKKQEIVDWALSNIETLKKYDLCGTGHTATLVEKVTKLPVKKFLSGPLGGDQQIGDMCGVKVAGENAFEIAPKPDGSVTRARAVYNSVYGTVSCGWTKTENGYRYAISVPSNTTARVILPDGTDKTVGAGEYKF